MVIMTRFVPEPFMQIIERYKVTYTLVVTPLVIALASDPCFEKYDMSSVETFGIGGAAMPQAVFNRYLARGVILGEGYGMSETMSTTTANPKERIKLGSVGVPMPGFNVRIADVKDLSRDVGIGEEGELWVQSISTESILEQPGGYRGNLLG